MERSLRHVRNAAVMSLIPAGTYRLRHLRNAAVMSRIEVETEIAKHLLLKRRRDERLRDKIRAAAR